MVNRARRLPNLFHLYTPICFRCTDSELTKTPTAEDIYLFLSTLMEVLNVDARDENLEIEVHQQAAYSNSVSLSRKNNRL